MARTNIPTHALTGNGGIAVPTATTADQANGMNIVLASETVPTGPGARDLVLLVSNTYSTPLNCIIRAGVGGGATPGPAFRSGLGDLSVSITNATSAYIGPLESARFAQLDGSVNVDFTTAFTGTITALLVPQHNY